MDDAKYIELDVHQAPISVAVQTAARKLSILLSHRKPLDSS
jgi:hypothetical protein